MSDEAEKTPSSSLERSSKDLLAEAIETLKTLAVKHVSGSGLVRARFFIDAIHADLDYGINPQQLIAAFNEGA